MTRPVLSATALSFALAVAAPPASRAVETRYLVGGDEKNTNITFESETDFETILGRSNQASGAFTADFDAGNLSIDVSVPVESLRTGIELRDKHLRSSDWLDAKESPEIRFVSRSARRLDEDLWEVSGDFTLHGVTHPLTAQGRVRVIDQATAKNAGLGKGDWVRIVAPFEVRLSQHGVAIPDKIGGRVSDAWKVRLVLFANAKG